MISANDLMQMKERMLVAGAAARAMVESPDTLRYEEDQYWRVHLALSMLHQDATAVLAELDTLRGMFRDRVEEFLGNGGFVNEVASSTNQDAVNPVDGVPAPVGPASSDGKRNDEAATGSPVPAKRSRRGRPRKQRPVEGGNSQEMPSPATGLVGRDSDGSVGGQ